MNKHPQPVLKNFYLHILAALKSKPCTTGDTMNTVYLLDYVAGNVRSLANAIEKLGFNIEWIREPKDFARAEVDSLRGLIREILTPEKGY